MTWCTLWVIFLIASLISSIVLLKTRFSDWSHDDIASRVSSTLVAIISIICSIIVFANSGKLESNFNPANQISLNATSKSTSTRESYYISKIYFNITNNSSVDVSSFYGEMKFYYLSSYIGSWNVTFNGDYASSSTKTAYVEFEEYSKEGNNLYSASFSSLHISFSITQMRFNDQYQVYQFNGSEFTVE